jgi:hypothetical protein
VILAGIRIRYWGQNKVTIVGVFNGPVVYCNVGVVLLARAVVLVNNFTSSYFEGLFWPLITVEILCPEANMSSVHKKQTNHVVFDLLQSKGTP